MELTERQAKYLRRFCYALCVASILALCLPMLISAIREASDGTARDPYTDLPVGRSVVSPGSPDQ